MECKVVMMGIKAGDILGFSGNGWLSFGINLLTYGIPYYNISHVGIVADVDDEDFPGLNKKPGFWTRHPTGLFLFESLVFPDPPCLFLLTGAPGVRASNIDESINRSRGRVWHYPCRHNLRPLHSRRLTRFLVDQLGKGYDKIGAFRAAGVGFSWLESLLRKEDLSSLFCSELCAAAYKHIWVMDTDHASKWSPNSFIRYCRKENILLEPKRLK
uniref:Peptidase n=1 Tax=viral metagenome TaxID=1070528 RepID=A0A6M3KW56_9ZZZZ